MARALSPEKRKLIMLQAKRLFAERGYSATSVADIAGVCDLPVGSIYTYFANKEEIVRAIVEEGWDELRSRLRSELASASTAEQKVRLLIDGFFPELLKDVDFITILLSEAIAYTRLEEKVDELVSLLQGILRPVLGSGRGVPELSRRDLQAALLVYFLGVMAAVRLSNNSSVKLTREEVLGFLRLTVRNALGLEV